MISSLPKPLQNDFDTIVIDILSRYSIDNKSVKRFVESVAQQVRDINRLPRSLNEIKPSRGKKLQDNKEDTLSNNKEKPNFLTRLEGYQSAWNKGSLVGVFLEYLKNRREDQQAKLVQSKPAKADPSIIKNNDKQPNITNTTNYSTVNTTRPITNYSAVNTTQPSTNYSTLNTINTSTVDNKSVELTQPSANYSTTNTTTNNSTFDNKDKQQPVAQTIKTELKVLESFTNKITEAKTNILERVVNNLQKIQDVFSSPGLLGATKNILSSYKEPEISKLISQTTTSTNYTAPSYNSSNTNYSTVNTTNTAATNNKSIVMTQGEAQAQRQDLLKEEQVVILGGINDEGAKDLKNILNTLFDEQNKNFLKKGGGAMLPIADEEEVGADSNLLDFLADYAMARSLFGGRAKSGASIGGGKKGAKARARARSQGRGYQKGGSSGAKPRGPTPKPSAKPGRFIPKPGPGGLLRGIGTLGLGILADWGGQMAGGEIAKGIYGEEKTAAAYEEYGADVFGLFSASYDATKAIGEAKEARERLEKQEKQTIPLDIKAMMYGYKDLADFGEAVSSGKENRRMYWDDQKQAVVVIQPDKTQEIHKFIYGKGFQGKPEIINPDGKKIVDKSMPTKNPDVKPLPPNTPKSDIEKPSIPIIPSRQTTPPSTSIDQTTSLISSSIMNQTTNSTLNSPITESVFAPATNTTTNTSPTTIPGISPSVSTSLLPNAVNNTNYLTSSITPETTKVESPVPPSVTETHITNNNADKKVLSDIAGNTEKTNKSLATLGDAVFKLAQVFDGKMATGGNNIVINSNGQAQQYTSTAQMAAANSDTTRRVRQQFLAAMS